MNEFISGLVIGICVGIVFMSILSDYLSKLERKKNYFIEYNNVTDEYELRDYNSFKWWIDYVVIFKHSLKEAVEDRYDYILEKEKNVPIKLKKKKNT
jgi:hypothetical protein